MGLASPNLTSVFEGTDAANDEFPETQLPYNSFFFSAVQQGLVSHPCECTYALVLRYPGLNRYRCLVFSVALDRGSFSAENNSLFDDNLGFLSFGGIAPVDVTDTAVTVPLQGYDAATFLPENGTSVTFFYYTVDVERMSFTGNKKVFGTTNSKMIYSIPLTLVGSSRNIRHYTGYRHDLDVCRNVCSKRIRRCL